MRPPSVFADAVSRRVVDAASRRAAALARVRIVPPRLSRSEAVRLAHELAHEKGIPFTAALYEVRKSRKEPSR